ncbi:hypothetical protein TNCV_1399711 [Trichonephila clavipes]|nr:hypothetical protein TNCV_1399711 [Trichonephila clavipes]
MTCAPTISASIEKIYRLLPDSNPPPWAYVTGPLSHRAYFYVIVAAPVYPLGAQGFGEDQKSLNKLVLTRFSGYKFRSSKARRCYAPRTRNELKPALNC